MLRCSPDSGLQNRPGKAVDLKNFIFNPKLHTDFESYTKSLHSKPNNPYRISSVPSPLVVWKGSRSLIFIVAHKRE